MLNKSISRREFLKISSVFLLSLYSPFNAGASLNRAKTLCHDILYHESIIGATPENNATLERILEVSKELIPEDSEGFTKKKRLCMGLEFELSLLGYSFDYSFNPLSESFNKRLVGQNNFCDLAYSLGQYIGTSVDIVEMNGRPLVFIQDEKNRLYYDMARKERFIGHEDILNEGNPRLLTYEEIISRSFVLIASRLDDRNLKIGYLKKAVGNYPSSENHYFMAIQLFNDSFYSSALENINISLDKTGVNLDKVDPFRIKEDEWYSINETIEYIFLKGSILLHSERYEETVQCMNSILRIIPDNQDAIILKEVAILSGYRAQ